jgi:aryl-alcohol dehydrogenase-like predicted oxidoreductase
MKRRHFIKSTHWGTGVVSLGSFPYHLYAGTEKKYPYDRVRLGSTGLEVSRMAMGTGTDGTGRSSNQTRQLGIKGLSDLLRSAYDEGIFFWDSADMYGSHPSLKETLKSVPREKVVILTKTVAKNAGEAKADIERFRQEIGTDYLDIVLVHAQTSSNWTSERKGVKEVLSEAKEKGIIKVHGVSCHSIGALRAAAADPWVELDLARFNPSGIAMDDEVAVVGELLQNMHKDGKIIMGMKVLGAGQLVSKIDESLQFQMGHDFISCFTIGVESRNQLKDLLVRIPAASIRG